MESFEPKKLALIRIWQILKEYSDYDHPLTQDDIARHLESDYGIVIERKAISRNISLLKEAGAEIESGRTGSYLERRDFEDSELKLLIDGVLCSKYITAKQSKDLIDRLCGLSNKYFRSHVKNIHSVNDWYKTDNQALFYNIELIDTAIEEGKQIHYDYNKYGVDKKLHKSSHQYMSPYLMILHNQRYYLMAYSEYWGNMAFHRLDRITNMNISDMYSLIAGIVGSGVAVEFRTWAKVYKDLPSIEEIFDGKMPSMPKNTDAMYALTASMSCYARTHKNELSRIANSIRYADKMPPDFSAVLLKDYMHIEKDFKQTLLTIPEFSKWLQTKGGLMNGSVK